MKTTNTIETKTNAGKTLVNFIEAMNKEDFKTARTYTTDDLSFVGVMGSRNGAEAYFKDMEHMKLKYDVKKIFENENDVCLLYDIDMSGKTIFSCGWYQLENGKIKTIRVIFDPRPLLDNAKKD